MDLINSHTYTYCEKCGALAEVDTSLPALYRYTCPKCGSVGYVVAYKTVTTINNDFSELDEKVDKETTDNKLDKVIELLTDIKELLEK